MQPFSPAFPTLSDDKTTCVVFWTTCVDEGRRAPTVQKARSARPDAGVLAVAHGAAMSIYLGRVLGINPLGFWRGLATPPSFALAHRWPSSSRPGRHALVFLRVADSYPQIFQQISGIVALENLITPIGIQDSIRRRCR